MKRENRGEDLPTEADKQKLKNFLLTPPNFAASLTAISPFPPFLLRHRMMKFHRGKPFQLQNSKNPKTSSSDQNLPPRKSNSLAWITIRILEDKYPETKETDSSRSSEQISNWKIGECNDRKIDEGERARLELWRRDRHERLIKDLMRFGHVSGNSLSVILSRWILDCQLSSYRVQTNVSKYVLFWKVFLL